jgi:hypothetical protein
MSRSELVARLLSELSAARAAIADSYQRLWPTAEQASSATPRDDRDQPRDAAEPAATREPDNDDDAAVGR